jgi:hypothetical protein
MTEQEIISEIIILEYEITSANLTGHRPSDNDQYSGKRERIKELRNMLWNIK